MQYMYVNWIHSEPDEPQELYSEIDDLGWEIRKIEIFRDGRVGCASLSHSSNSTGLSIEEIPSIEEIAMDAQFSPKEITKADFEKVWNLYSHEILPTSPVD
jgi:hypothetical protein